MCDHDVKTVTTQALRRMPYYIQQLKILHNESIETVSARKIAEALKLNEVQVRKDFAAVSPTHGKPKSGFAVSELLYNMEEFLGYHNADDAVIIGTGPLGQAVLAYEGIQDYGINIVAAFDTDSEEIPSQINGIKVLPSLKIKNLCRRMKIHIGIITVSAVQAQSSCDQLVAGGVIAIWNLTPVHLSVPDHVLVQDENIAGSLAMMSEHLRKVINE